MLRGINARLPVGAMIGVLGLMSSTGSVNADSAWSFGVMTDTQGSGHPDVQPNNVSTRLMEPVVDRFVNTHGVDMMISVGDLTGQGRPNEFAQWKETAEPIYNANIPVYPTRGNHDVKTESLSDPVYDPLFDEHVEYRKTDLWDEAFPYLDSGSDQFDSRLTPGPGASYTFEHNNTRFAAVDVYGARPVDLVGWMQNLERGDHDHMFVYGHEPFFGRARGGALGSGPTRDAFLQTLADNGIEAYLAGDHHQYNRSSFVNETKAELQHVIAGSNAEKYYRFERPYDEPAEMGHRQINGEVGYSVAKIKGPFVIFKHFSSPAPDPEDPDEVFSPDWRLADKWVHATNGDAYAIAAGESYAGLTSAIEGDGFLGTSAEILDGTNSDFRTLQTEPDAGSGESPVTATLGDNVNFGWAEREAGHVSDVLWLTGLDDDLDGETVPYTLAMGFDAEKVEALSELRLMHKTNDGWVAVNELLDDAADNPIIGAYQDGYGLGDFGVNPDTNRIWAVLDREGQFAVKAIPEPTSLALLGIGGLSLARRQRRRKVHA